MRIVSYANVASTLALVVALSGGAYAATQLPKNSVTSKQVKNGSLKAADFKAGQLPAGPAGPAGAPAVSLFAAVLDTDGTNPATLGTNKGALSVSDPAGENNNANPYVVYFNRDLTGCVALATVGATSAPSNYSVGPVAVRLGGTAVNVFAKTTDSPSAPQDTSFMVAVYC